MLPATLRIRQGTEITSGQLALNVTSRQDAKGTTWSGRVDASDLAANSDGRALVWKNPLAVQFVTHETDAGLSIEKAHCTSQFLQLDASGSVDDLTLQTTFDLATLVKELRQFADLDNVQLAGRGQGQLVWKRTSGDQFTANGQFQTRGFQYVIAGSRAWKEDNLVARLDLTGALKDSHVQRIDQATLSVEAGSERLQAKLQSPVSEPTTAAWPLLVAWRG